MIVLLDSEQKQMTHKEAVAFFKPGLIAIFGKKPPSKSSRFLNKKRKQKKKKEPMKAGKL